MDNDGGGYDDDDDDGIHCDLSWVPTAFLPPSLSAHNTYF